MGAMVDEMSNEILPPGGFRIEHPVPGVTVFLDDEAVTRFSEALKRLEAALDGLGRFLRPREAF